MDRLYDYRISEMYPNWEGRKYLTIEVCDGRRVLWKKPFS